MCVFDILTARTSGRSRHVLCTQCHFRCNPCRTTRDRPSPRVAVPRQHSIASPCMHAHTCLALMGTAGTRYKSCNNKEGKDTTHHPNSQSVPWPLQQVMTVWARSWRSATKSSGARPLLNKHHALHLCCCVQARTPGLRRRKNTDLPAGSNNRAASQQIQTAKLNR